MQNPTICRIFQFSRKQIVFLDIIKNNGVFSYFFLKWFFRFWTVNVTVPWKFSAFRSKALLLAGSNVLRRSVLQPFIVLERSMSVPELKMCFRPFVIFLRPKSTETALKRSWTVFILYKMNGLKRFQNHVPASKTKETL